MIRLNYIVTGTGRCGTVWTARFLTSVGINCGHETIFDWKGLHWAKKRLQEEVPLELSFVAQKEKHKDESFTPMEIWVDLTKVEADSSYLAAPFLKENILRGTKIIHIVRDPFKVINSFCNYLGYFSNTTGNNSYEQIIYRFLPELKSEKLNAYDRAALYWVRWNQMIEPSAHFFYRVEDPPELLLKFLNKNTDRYFQNTKVNSWQKPIEKPFDISMISNDMIKRECFHLAKKYGYLQSLVT